ncbi:MAG: hypothetical protein BGO69_17190 [Bacteroidetes bacterium 46-16]|nr:MAG: hypothetical protein BGO69_17190 [Bacteroidetes bacterium 46-16]
MYGFLQFLLDNAWVIFKYIGIFCLIWVIFSYFTSPIRSFDNITNTWYQPFADQHYSVSDFYTLVEEMLKEKKIKNLEISRVHHSEQYVLSSRQYLQILWGDQMVLVCASPFGTDFFISVRHGQPLNFLQDFFMRIPKIGKWIAAAYFHKSFYRLDTDAMFQATVKYCIDHAIQRMTAAIAGRMDIAPEIGTASHSSIHPA